MDCVRNWLVVLGVLLGCAGAHAQGTYPSKTITVIIPISPGGVTDRMGRIFSAGMGKVLGQSVVVMNRGGANGTLGANVVAKAPPDGYTLCFCNSAPVTLAKFTMDAMPYDMDRALVPVTRVYDLSPIVVVPGGSTHTSLAELIKAAKANPGMTFGHTGTGGALHLGFELLLDKAEASMTAVAYPGESPMLADLATGRLNAGVVSAQFASAQAASGNARVLGAMGSVSPLQGVPTVAQSGYPGFHATSLAGFLAPAGTPTGILLQIDAALQAVMNDAEIRTALSAAGLTPVVGEGPKEFAQFVEQEKRNWSQVIQKIRGIKK
jgi:tripartite-type tricarboxylate transporter receptor subunit TctC